MIGKGQKIADWDWIIIDRQWLPIISNDWTVIDYPALAVVSLLDEWMSFFLFVVVTLIGAWRAVPEVSCCRRIGDKFGEFRFFSFLTTLRLAELPLALLGWSRSKWKNLWWCCLCVIPSLRALRCEPSWSVGVLHSLIGVIEFLAPPDSGSNGDRSGGVLWYWCSKTLSWRLSVSWSKSPMSWMMFENLSNFGLDANWWSCDE